MIGSADDRRIRVLRIYHSAVVDEYRQRERVLRARHGYDVHLVCPPSWAEGGSVVAASTDPEVPVHIVEVRGRRHPILFWYATNVLRRVIRHVRPHIVDLHEEPYSLAAAGVLWALRREAPNARVCIYSAQNIRKRYPPPFRQLERRALRTAAAAYPCSTEAGEVMRAKGFRGAVRVLPLGVSVDTDRPPRTAPGLRVGFVGRLEPYKGAELAVRAFARAAGAGDGVLEIVGSGSQEPALRACAERLAIGSRVLLAGALTQDDALRRIATYDVLLIPSLTTPTWKEQFGRVAAQAMAAGTPVIASDCGSLPEVVDGCGELVREGDLDDLADTLSRLLGDPARRSELARRGRRRAVEHFSWEAVAKGCDAMYRDVLVADGPS